MVDIADGVHRSDRANDNIRTRHPMAGRPEATFHRTGGPEDLTNGCSRSCPHVALSDWA
jgi:hypothetical protein